MKKVEISDNYKEQVNDLDELYETNKRIEIFIPIENIIKCQRKHINANIISVSEFSV